MYKNIKMSNNEEKKFSFSFTKQLKKSNIINSENKVDTKTENIQLIDCVEENSIKVIGGENEIKKQPLVIPLTKNSKKITASEGSVNISENPTTELSIEDIAVQELINESKNISTNQTAPLVHTIPKLSENGEITGEPESTLDDYENVPINEFGFAMLRGMGWKEDQEKNPKSTKKMPVVRPKGMGLGADKLRIDKNSTQSQASHNGEQLKIIKDAFVKIISGRYSNMLGQVQGFDDDAGSVIIKLALSGNIVSLQEFLVEPITKSEYDKNSKVINLQKYAEYDKKDKKNLENDNHKDLSSKEYESKKQKNHSNKHYDSDSEDSDVSKRNRKHQDKNSKLYSETNDKREKNISKSNKQNDFKYPKNKNSSDSDSEYEYKSHRKNKYRDDRYDSKYKRNDEDIDSYRDRSRHYEKYSRDEYTNSNSSKYSKHKSNRDYDDSYNYKKSSSKSRRSRSK